MGAPWSPRPATLAGWERITTLEPGWKVVCIMTRLSNCCCHLRSDLIIRVCLLSSFMIRLHQRWTSTSSRAPNSPIIMHMPCVVRRTLYESDSKTCNSTFKQNKYFVPWLFLLSVDWYCDLVSYYKFHLVIKYIFSSPTSAAYMRRWTGSALV